MAGVPEVQPCKVVPIWGKASAGASHRALQPLSMGHMMARQLSIFLGKTEAPEGFGCHQPPSRHLAEEPETGVVVWQLLKGSREKEALPESDVPGVASDLNTVFLRASRIRTQAEREAWDWHSSLRTVFPQRRIKSRFSHICSVSPLWVILLMVRWGYRLVPLELSAQQGPCKPCSLRLNILSASQ